MSGAVTTRPDTEVAEADQPRQGARQEPLRQLLTSEPAILAAMLLSLGIFYIGPGLPSVIIGLAAFFALTVYRPQLSLAMVPLVAPLFFMPRQVAGRIFSLAEVIIVVGVAAWVIRDGWDIVRARRLPNLAVLTRQPGLIVAALLLLIGGLWLLVPERENFRFAFREFRWTIAEPLLFFAMMLRWLRTERDVWRMVGAWLVGAALIGREGAEQFLFGQTWSMEGVGRVTSVYPSATAFGIYMGRPLALALALAFFLPRRWMQWRIAAGLLAFVIGLGVFFSFARGAWIGVFMGMAVLALITRHRRLSLAVGGVFAAGLASVIVGIIFGIERFSSMLNFASPDNTGLSRLKIWSSAVNVLRDHPFTGIGQDQFLRQDAVKYGIPHIRFLEVSHPHNWVLDFWLRLGLPGLAWMVGALTFFFYQTYRLWRTHRGTALGALALGLIAAMIDLAVHGLLDMAYFTMDLALSFWLLLGLAMVATRLPRAEEA